MLDTIGSFLIGSLVLLMMVGVMLNLQSSTSETVMNEISQVTMAEMSQMMDREMNNLGYRVRFGKKLVDLKFDQIVFRSDFDNNGAVDTILYRMEMSADGPAIVRTITQPGKAPVSWRSNGSLVLFTGYDSTGNVTSDPDLMRGIESTMLTSNVLYSDETAPIEAVVLTGVDKKTQQLVTTQDQLLAESIDCNAGAYYHKIVYPENLSLEFHNFSTKPVAGGTP